MGCLGYADDLALIAPSTSALRRMLACCVLFASEMHLSFNAAKTQLVCFRRHKTIPVTDVVIFCGQPLHFSDTVVHLGHTLSCDLSDTADVVQKTRTFSRQANSVLLNFG